MVWADEVKAALDIVKEALALHKSGEKRLSGKQRQELIELYHAIMESEGLIKKI